jgi:CO/xanthine dehydrogenase Mo-binding subunit
VLAFALLMSADPTAFRTYARPACAVYTNKLRSGSYRGFGNPQASFAGESQIDDLAVRLGIDPVALRLQNAMRPGDTAFGGQPVSSCIVAECSGARARCTGRGGRRCRRAPDDGAASASR